MYQHKKLDPAPYKKSPLFSMFVESWWVLLFIFMSLIIYSHAATKKNLEFSELQSRVAVLEQEKQWMLDQQKELKLEVQSHSDPAWIELSLMKGLGVVPEGYRKVFFKKEE